MIWPRYSSFFPHQTDFFPSLPSFSGMTFSDPSSKPPPPHITATGNGKRRVSAGSSKCARIHCEKIRCWTWSDVDCGCILRRRSSHLHLALWRPLRGTTFFQNFVCNPINGLLSWRNLLKYSIFGGFKNGVRSIDSRETGGLLNATYGEKISGSKKQNQPAGHVSCGTNKLSVVRGDFGLRSWDTSRVGCVKGYWLYFSF